MHGVNPGFFTPNELIPQLIAEEMKRLLVRKIQFWSVKILIAFIMKLHIEKTFYFFLVQVAKKD